MPYKKRYTVSMDFVLLMPLVVPSSLVVTCAFGGGFGAGGDGPLVHGAMWSLGQWCTMW